MKRDISRLSVALFLLAALPAFSREKQKDPGPDPYYKGMQTFQGVPDSRNLLGCEVRNFGPVGLGLELINPNFTIKIVRVDPGTPAAATGKLMPGQIIESINGKTLKERDPRELLGEFIAESEAGDGKMILEVKGQGKVVVQLEPLGAYSATWPLNCPKSDKIVRRMADLLAKQEEPHWGSVMFMLSTGEEKDLAVVKRWMAKAKPQGVNFGRGIEGIGLCEYYLRTGDQAILPLIHSEAEQLKKDMWFGSWNARGGPARYGYGVLNASGVGCCSFLLMAQLCGVEVDPYTLNTSLQQFYRFAGHGSVAYGDSLPEGGFRDNGKTSAMAMTMAAAALLSPYGEKSNYAKARDMSARKAFYATNWFNAGHTGGGIGEVWRHCAMSLVADKYPQQYRSFFDTRKWFMDLSRRPDGSIGVGGQVMLKSNTRYDTSATEGEMSFGTWMALCYTIPRKHLQLFGAPRSPYAKHHAGLSIRPEGNAQDDIFLDPSPIPGGGLTMEDLKKETVGRDASYPTMMRINDPEVSDETLLRYLHHPELGIRDMAMRKVCELDRTDIVISLMKAGDARLRHAGLLALTGPFKGAPIKTKTPEMFDLAEKMIQDKNEAWWVVQEALRAVAASGDLGIVERNKARIVELERYPSRYVSDAAMNAMRMISLDPKHQDLLPVVAQRGMNRDAVYALCKEMESASPDTKTNVGVAVKEAFNKVPEVMKFPGGAICSDGSDYQRTQLGKLLDLLPGGSEFLLQRTKTTTASLKSGKDADKFRFDGKFKPLPQFVGVWSKIYLPNGAFNKPEEAIQAWMDGQTKKGKVAFELKIEGLSYAIRLEPDGKADILGFLKRTMGQYVWSSNMLIGKYSDEALRMERLSYKGCEFLIVEKPLFDVSEVDRSAEEDADDSSNPDEEKPSSSGCMDGKMMFVKVPDEVLQDLASREKEKNQKKAAEKKARKLRITGHE